MFDPERVYEVPEVEEYKLIRARPVRDGENVPSVNRTPLAALLATREEVQAEMEKVKTGLSSTKQAILASRPVTV